MNNKIELSKIELEQIINEEINENRATLVVHKTNNYNTSLRCFYDEVNIDKLIQLIQNTVTIYVNNKKQLIKATLKDKSVLTIEIL